MQTTNFTLNKDVENWYAIFFGHETSLNICEKHLRSDTDIQKDKHQQKNEMAI